MKLLIYNETESSITSPSFESVDDFFEIQLTPGVYDLVDVNRTIKQKIFDFQFGIYIEGDTI